MAGKKWLEQPKTKPPLPENSASPIRGNLSEPLPKNPDSEIVRNKPIIATERPSNSLLNIRKGNNSAITNYQPQPVIRQISPKTLEKFSLNTSKQLPVITNGEQPVSKEQILLAKIKQLEEQLKQVQAENEKLKTENKHLKSLIRKDQETEAKVIQSLPFKPNK